MTSSYLLYNTYSELCPLSYIQAYSGIFTSYSDIFNHGVAYLEPFYIQNPGIFRAQDIFRTLSSHILAYLKHYVTLAYWEPCHIQNLAIFRNLAYLGPEAYSESCLYRHIQAYSGIYFHFDFTYFSRKFKKNICFWLQWPTFQCSTESAEIKRDLWKQHHNRRTKTHIFLGK